MTFSEIVESKKCKIDEVRLVGFQGQSMVDEGKLFEKLNDRLNEIIAKYNDQYLVVSGKFPIPIVGVSVWNSANVPKGMITYTIPKGEYVKFMFRKEHIGDFWSNICTDENQAKYNIDLAEPRFEISTSHLQSTSFIEWYIPTR